MSKSSKCLEIHVIFRSRLNPITKFPWIWSKSYVTKLHFLKSSKCQISIERQKINELVDINSHKYFIPPICRSYSQKYEFCTPGWDKFDCSRQHPPKVAIIYLDRKFGKIYINMFKIPGRTRWMEYDTARLTLPGTI